MLSNNLIPSSACILFFSSFTLPSKIPTIYLSKEVFPAPLLPIIPKHLNGPILQETFEKMLKFSINEKNKQLAKDKVMKICDELRIYNPLVSKITVNVIED